MAERVPLSAKSQRAWAAFRVRVAELGGIVLEESWLGATAPHLVRCAAGHDCKPRPNDVQQKHGVCRTCADRTIAAARVEAAWAAFQIRVTDLGGVVLEETWLGNNTPHRVRCGAGHECLPRPAGVQQGQGLCRTCVGNDPKVIQAAFRARVAELGGVVLEETWLGVHTPHRVRCAAGHECSPAPRGVIRGQGLCRTCAGNDSEVAQAAFRVRVAELGGIVLEEEWLGKGRPHRVRCVAGHEGSPYPGNVRQGGGICRVCANQVWDVFYVVLDEDAEHVKFGITSGDHRPRLSDHARDGFTMVIRILKDLPGTTAPDLERAVLSTLRLANEMPVRGREYYRAEVLPVVLDVVDNYHLAPRAEREPTDG